jgi:membrane protein DedA with SNARE-associated domain/membrane-associated phospholipid phosphatase
MSSDIVSSILQWLNTHPEYSWFITFIISASESIAVIGTIIPGSITMTALGALAGSGIIPLWGTVFWAFFGAVVGDGISYWMGYYFKDRIAHIWPFKNNLSLLAKGEKFFNRYGGMGVFIGRFIGPIRALIPVVAGMMGMRPLYFLIANVASAAGWAPAYMLPGILLGAASLELPPDIATRVILILFFWALFILLCLWLIRKIPHFVHRHIVHLFTRVWKKLQHSRALGTTTLRNILQHHNPDKSPLQLTLTFYFFVMCGIFIYLASYVHLQGSGNIPLNQSVYHLFRGIYSPQGRNLMVYLTLLGQKQVILPVAFIIIAWFFIKRQWHVAFHAAGLFVLTVLAVISIKNGLQSPRPWGIVKAPESFSFPSGHTTLTTTFYVGLALLLSHAYSGKARKFLYTLIGLIILAVSLSRLYLGAHWFTDILGGWILSAALLTVVTISYNRKMVHMNPRRLLALTLLVLAIIYAFMAQRYIPQLEKNFTQLNLPTQETELKAWDQQTQTYLPEQRVSLFGFPSQAINIEWIGDLTTIEKSLLKHDWQTPPKRDWLDVLFRLSGIQSAEHLPLISPLYLDKRPALVLVRYMPDEKKLVVLRLWQSNIILKGTKEPLWVGVVGLVPKTYGWLSRRYKMDIEITPELVFNRAKPKMKLKIITVNIPSKKKDPKQTILLIRQTQ